MIDHEGQADIHVKSVVLSTQYSNIQLVLTPDELSVLWSMLDSADTEERSSALLYLFST